MKADQKTTEQEIKEIENKLNDLENIKEKEKDKLLEKQMELRQKIEMERIKRKKRWEEKLTEQFLARIVKQCDTGEPVDLYCQSCSVLDILESHRFENEDFLTKIYPGAGRLAVRLRKLKDGSGRIQCPLCNRIYQII